MDRIVELCTRDIRYIWLAKGKQAKRDVFYDFMNEKLTNEILRGNSKGFTLSVYVKTSKGKLSFP